MIHRASGKAAETIGDVFLTEGQLAYLPYAAAPQISADDFANGLLRIGGGLFGAIGYLYHPSPPRPLSLTAGGRTDHTETQLSRCQFPARFGRRLFHDAPPTV